MNKTILDQFMCLIGIHQYDSFEIWDPSFDAPVVKGFEQTIYCVHCGKVKCKEWVSAYSGENNE